MKYLLMCSFNETAWSQLPNSERDQIVNNYGSCIQEMKRSGHYLAGVNLDQRATPLTVRRKTNAADATKRLSENAKEQLGGDHLVECKNLTEAILLAKRIPARSSGAVEVRAVLAHSQG